MAHDNHSTVTVPKELLSRHQQGWSAFTRATTQSCVALAVLLLLMLFFFKVV